MDPTIAANAQSVAGPGQYLNIEYIFSLIYTLINGGNVGQGGFSVAGIISFLTTLWIIVTIVAYLVVAAALVVLIYATIRLHQVEMLEEQKYQTVHDTAHAIEETEHHRWANVRELIESASPNDWRQAIIEADIILDDMLTRIGYIGSSIGEKLKSANPAYFRTLQEAWEAHKVRNEIAHQGSTYQLSDQLAYRTILHYENVFKEHGEI